LVQGLAMRAWRERRPFFDLLASDPAVTRHVSAEELKACFEPAWYVRNVDPVFRRLGLT
jgi:adenylosuccinate lyase